MRASVRRAQVDQNRQQLSEVTLRDTVSLSFYFMRVFCRLHVSITILLLDEGDSLQMHEMNLWQQSVLSNLKFEEGGICET